MDSTDKKILFFLLKDGRMPQRQIAKSIGISAQTLNYRMSKLIEDGVIQDFGIKVNPSIYGKVEGYAAFVSDHELTDGYSLIMKCLEKITLYGFTGNSKEEVEQIILEKSKELGNPVMKYMPESISYSGNSKSIDDLIIEQLRKYPRETLSVIAKNIEMPRMSVKRRYNFLRKNNILGVITKVDLSKTDGVVFSIFTISPGRVAKILDDITFLEISDSSSGVFLCFAQNMTEAKNFIDNARREEKDSEVMVVYDYDIKT